MQTKVKRKGDGLRYFLPQIAILWHYLKYGTRVLDRGAGSRKATDASDHHPTYARSRRATGPQDREELARCGFRTAGVHVSKTGDSRQGTESRTGRSAAPEVWSLNLMARRAVEQLASTSEACRKLTEFAEEWERWRLRRVFFHAIQGVFPSFWQILNDSWRKHGPEALGYSGFANLVIDSWFVKGISVTLNHWTEHPDSPQAQLEDGYWWFVFEPTWYVPQFSPVFTDPEPRGLLTDKLSIEEKLTLPFERARIVQTERHEKQPAESEEQFYRRMDAQYGAYKEAHRKALFGVESNHPEAYRDAAFTVATFFGLSSGQSKRFWEEKCPGVAFNFSNTEKTIYRAVKRFSARIDLGIPGWKR
jgi:hypothetical protein